VPFTKRNKINFLNKVTPRTKNIFQSILNVTEEFCSSIEECDYVLLPPTHIYEYSVQKYKSEIKTAIKNNKKIIIFMVMMTIFHIIFHITWDWFLDLVDFYQNQQIIYLDYQQ
jgi:hypothetical protein